MGTTPHSAHPHVCIAPTAQRGSNSYELAYNYATAHLLASDSVDPVEATKWLNNARGKVAHSCADTFPLGFPHLTMLWLCQNFARSTATKRSTLPKKRPWKWPIY